MTDAGLEHTDFLGRAFAEIYGKPGGIGASVGYAETTDLLFLRLVTLTRLPKGRVRWAAVMAW